MINITVPTGVAGRVTAQVYKKDKDGNKVKVEGTNKSCGVDNIITQAGLNSIDGSSLVPNLRFNVPYSNNYIGLGEGTQEETLGVEHLANGRTLSPSIPVSTNTNTYTNDANRVTSKRTVKYPTDRVNNPAVHEIVLTCEFSEQGVARNYTEIGIIGNPQDRATPVLSDPQKNITLTYTLFRDENGLPTSIAVAADEYLLISYTYQIQIMQHFPVNVPVTGTGIPGGVVACLYRKARNNAYNTPSIGIYHFNSEEDYNNSNWVNAFDKFHRLDSELVYSDLYPNYAMNGSYGMLGSSSHINNDDSVGGGILSGYPSYYTASLNGGEYSVTPTGYRVWANQGKFSLDADTKYIVGWGAQYSSSIVTFNKPIPFVPKYDKVDFSVTINFDTTNKDWIDVSTIV